jgi:hypothetical protein
MDKGGPALSGSLRASAVGKSSGLSDAVAIRKAATPLTATARMKPATIAFGGAHPLAGLRLLSLDATLCSRRSRSGRRNRGRSRGRAGRGRGRWRASAARGNSRGRVGGGGAGGAVRIPERLCRGLGGAFLDGRAPLRLFRLRRLIERGIVHRGVSGIQDAGPGHGGVRRAGAAVPIPYFFAAGSGPGRRIIRRNAPAGGTGREAQHRREQRGQNALRGGHRHLL